MFLKGNILLVLALFISTFNIAQQPRLVLPVGSTNIQSAFFSPDGKHILGTAKNGSLYLWETASGRLLRIFNGHLQPVEWVKFSPDGRYVISASAELLDNVIVWDVQTGALLWRTAGSGDDPGTVSFLEGGRELISTRVNYYSVFDIDSAREIRSDRNEDGTCQYFNNGKNLYAARKGKAAILLEKLLPGDKEWKQVCILRDSLFTDDKLKNLFSSYGRWFFVDSSGRYFSLYSKDSIRLYDGSSGEFLTGSGGNDINFSPGNRYCLFSNPFSVRNPSRVWDMESRKWIWEGEGGLTFSGTDLITYTITSAPQDKSKWELYIRGIDLPSGKSKWECHRNGKGVLYYPLVNSGLLLIQAKKPLSFYPARNADVELIHLDNGRVFGPFREMFNEGWNYFDHLQPELCIHSNSLLTVTDSVIRRWDIVQNKTVGEISFRGENRVPADLEFSADGNSLYTGNKAIDVQTGRTLLNFPGKVEKLDVEKERVLVHVQENKYVLYDLKTGVPKLEIPGDSRADPAPGNDNYFAAQQKDSLLWLADLGKGSVFKFKGEPRVWEDSAGILISSTAVFEENNSKEEESNQKKPAVPPQTFIWDYKKGTLLRKFDGAFIRALEYDLTDKKNAGKPGLRYLLVAMPDSSTVLYDFFGNRTYHLPGAFKWEDRSSDDIITSDKNLTYIINRNSATITRKIPGHFEAYEPDAGNLTVPFLTTSTGKQEYCVWQPKKNELIYTYTASQPFPVKGYRLSPDKKGFILYTTRPGYAYDYIVSFYNGKLLARDTVKKYCVDSAFTYLGMIRDDNTIRLRNLLTGELTGEFKKPADAIGFFEFIDPLGREQAFEIIGPDKYVLIPGQKTLLKDFFGYAPDSSLGYRYKEPDSILVYDFHTRKINAYYTGNYESAKADRAKFRIYVLYIDSIRVLDITAGRFVTSIPGTFLKSYVNDYICTFDHDSTVLWNKSDFRPVASIPGKLLHYSKLGMMVSTQRKRGWVFRNLQPVTSFELEDPIEHLAFNDNYRLLLISTAGNKEMVIRADNGQSILPSTERLIYFYYKKIILAGSDAWTSVYSQEDGRFLFRMRGKFKEYSVEESRYFTTSVGDSLYTWDAFTGDRIHSRKKIADSALITISDALGYELLVTKDTISFIVSRDQSFRSAPFLIKYLPPEDRLYGKIVDYFTVSADRSQALIVQDEFACQIVNLRTGEIKNLSNLLFFEHFSKGSFSSNGQFLFTTSGYSGGNERVRVHSLWNCRTGERIIRIGGRESEDLLYALSRDGRFFSVYQEGMIRLFELKEGKLLYQYMDLDKDNSLITDAMGHYDGSPSARKLPYFTCGNEIVELDQVKDQLWVPNLAERIMKGDSINAKTLDQLNICGLTPEVEDKNGQNGEYRFEIRPRRGGLGETVLYVNGIEAKRYAPAALEKNSNGYSLLLTKKELSGFLIAGKENTVTVKAYTADNTISSRGIRVTNTDTSAKVQARPNLYALMVGVSDYKGDGLDLKYAAKDAADLSNALSTAAEKLLNSDGREHVFIYNLITSEKRYQLPEKNAIKKLLEEIGTKATANDILVIFFAGHGVMGGLDKKQFYFLTADASPSSALEAVADVGISTTELTEWMKPQNIKAQKRVLIFDACNSGQAIRDIVKVGNDNQGYVAARGDEQGRQVKAIDKLNEQSGFFILSASASDQSAYELGRYAQGLLTYALLKAIKQQPDILEEGKYLDLSRWFNAAEKTVSELSKETGARQQPQIVSNNNFNIGIVDEEVIAKIILPQEKPLFAASNFQNSDETIADDDMELSKLVNLQLNDLAARGTESKIVYVTATNSPDAYSLTGRYTVRGNQVIVTVNVKQNRVIKNKFELSGLKDKLNELVAALVKKATELAD